MTMRDFINKNLVNINTRYMVFVSFSKTSYLYFVIKRTTALFGMLNCFSLLRASW